MKILMILESEFPPDVRVEKEIRTLTQKGHHIYLIATSKNKRPSIEKTEQLEIYRIYKSLLMHKLSALALSIPFYFNYWNRHIERFLNKFPVDIIHLHDLPLASVIYKIGIKYKIPIVFDFHENRPEIMKFYAHVNTTYGKLLISTRKWEAYQEKYCKLADRLILVTPEAKTFYERKYLVNPETTYVVPNFADIDYLKSFTADKNILEKYQNKFMLIYFGDTGIRRGTLTIIKAANLLKDDPKYHFVIIGNSKEHHKLIAKVKEYGLNNVDLPGFLEFRQIVHYILASKVGLCPFLRNTHHDTTYANKLFQFLYFGKPVIVSDCPAQVAIVNESKVGLVHRANDYQDLADKILKIENHSNFDMISQNAKEAVLEKYNTINGNKSLLELYTSFEN